jgi:SCY1-like protein 2
MLAVASNLFGKSSSLGAYTLHSASPSGTPSSSSTNLASTTSASSFNVGLWKVVGATHKTTNKDVSVWIFEKRVLEGIRDARGKERVLEALRKEVSVWLS